MIQLPRTLESLKALIRDQVQESLHLDYKASDALTSNKKDELSKDVSAFANSDGGVIVYGIREKEHLPYEIDQGAPNDKVSREQIENVIRSMIAPRIPDIEIVQIQISETHSAFAIAIGKTSNGPHQDRKTFKYYKRYNFQSAPMEDYEIQDIRNRSAQIPNLIEIDIEIDQGAVFVLCVKNIGNATATDIRFEFSRDIPWRIGQLRQFKEGIRTLSKGKKLVFWIGVTAEVLAENSKFPKDFVVSVSYNNSITNSKAFESFEIDFSIFEGMLAPRSDLDHNTSKLEKVLARTASSMENISRQLDHLQTVAGPTGLDLSFSTWRHISNLMNVKNPVKKIDPAHQNYALFQEVLGVDTQLAIRIQDYFAQPNNDCIQLTDVVGMTDEIRAEIERCFIV